jgi:hypothetical protein
VWNGKLSVTDFLWDDVLPGLAGGALFIGTIFALQRMGIDVIGMFFNVLFFIFDMFFAILRFSLASEGNLVAFVVIFLIIWLIILVL